MTGGAQAPGTQSTASSRNIDVKTGPAHHVPTLRETYFNNQYPRKLGGVTHQLGEYGKFQGNRYVQASHYGGGDDSRQIGGRHPSRAYKKLNFSGGGYPGDRMIISDTANVTDMKGRGGTLPGSGYPADKLLKKMRKKISKKNTRKPVYFDNVNDIRMSHFLAKKLAPMISVH